MLTLKPSAITCPKCGGDFAACDCGKVQPSPEKYVNIKQLEREEWLDSLPLMTEVGWRRVYTGVRKQTKCRVVYQMSGDNRLWVLTGYCGFSPTMSEPFEREHVVARVNLRGMTAREFAVANVQ